MASDDDWNDYSDGLLSEDDFNDDNENDSDDISLDQLYCRPQDRHANVVSRHQVKEYMVSEQRRLELLCDISDWLRFRLLNEFQWDSNKVLLEYVTAPAQTLARIGADPASPDTNKGSNRDKTQNWECPVCRTSTKDTPGEIERYMLCCCHPVCVECFQEYLKVNVVREKRLYTTTCPGNAKCNVTVCRTDAEALLDVADMERYTENELQLYLDTLGHDVVRQCPHPDCEFVAFGRRSLQERTVHCGCGHDWCYDCGLPLDHMAVPCNIAELWLALVNHEHRSQHWLRRNTKYCPRCGSRIERDEGCNHMTCGNCSHEFCWMCAEPWSEHTGNSTYNCARFTATENSNGVQSQNRNQKALIRHYSLRFDSHMIIPGDQKSADKLDKVLEHAHRTLAWAYVLLCFVVNSNQKVILEDNVNDLDTAVQTLLRQGWDQPPDLKLIRYVDDRNDKLKEFMMGTSWKFDRNLVQRLQS